MDISGRMDSVDRGKRSPFLYTTSRSTDDVVIELLSERTSRAHDTGHRDQRRGSDVVKNATPLHEVQWDLLLWCVRARSHLRDSKEVGVTAGQFCCIYATPQLDNINIQTSPFRITQPRNLSN